MLPQSRARQTIASFAVLTVLWFKRDLRLDDHEALQAALARGPVLPLYIVEPDLWRQGDLDLQHARFLEASLRALDQALRARGSGLWVREGHAVSVLEALRRSEGFTHLESHEETGNGWTYARDRAVKAWCRAEGIPWGEHQTFGVTRGLRNRNRFSRGWEGHMTRPARPTPARVPGPPAPAVPWTQLFQNLPTSAFHPAVPHRSAPLVAGEGAAQARLTAFLEEAGADYHRRMSAPAQAVRSGSRLSHHLAWGSLSLRRVVQRVRAAKQQPEQAPALSPRARSAFEARLHWHCHFIQKLEAEPALETVSFNRALDTLRPRGPSDALDAWLRGQTGWPFVDAAMRALQHWGWINFRMRAMLVSVAAYHLWLDWRDLNHPLARQFIDYEPGIHISQLQMQSGVTGINALRIYNPLLQGQRLDPKGTFIRTFVPELAPLRDDEIHQPWLLSARRLAQAGVRLRAPGPEALTANPAYPRPLVDAAQAARSARARVGTAQRQEASRQESRRVLMAHGSRKNWGQNPRPKLKTAPQKGPFQGELF